MWTRAGLCIVLLGVCTQVAAKERQISVQELSSSFEQLNKTVGPSDVHITASGYQPSDLGGNRFVISKQRSSGSGVIVDSNGYIITNAHVVRGHSDIAVTLSDGRRLGARVIGEDQQSDLAVVEVRAIGLVSPLMREVAEMRYMWRVPHRVDGSRLSQVLPGLPRTPPAEAIAKALAAWKPADLTE